MEGIEPPSGMCWPIVGRNHDGRQLNFEREDVQILGCREYKDKSGRPSFRTLLLRCGEFYLLAQWSGEDEFGEPKDEHILVHRVYAFRKLTPVEAAEWCHRLGQPLTADLEAAFLGVRIDPRNFPPPTSASPLVSESLPLNLSSKCKGKPRQLIEAMWTHKNLSYEELARIVWGCPLAEVAPNGIPSAQKTANVFLAQAKSTWTISKNGDALRLKDL